MFARLETTRDGKAGNPGICDRHGSCVLLFPRDRDPVDAFEWEMTMSLGAVLKAGLGARDANEPGSEGGWDPYPSGDDNGKPAPASKALSSKATPAVEPSLGAGLSDSLPKPKLTAPPTRRPANANASANLGSELEGAAHANGQVKARIAELGRAPAKTGNRVNPQQYIRELDRFHAEQNRNQTQDAVMDVASGEVERVARLAAKVRGRYIAKLLDAGNSEQAGLKEAELLELRRYRESHEELCRGLELLKSAISEGDITVSGMVRR
jgi:hypothetical protein